jgi:hypothetical protein
MGFGASRTPNRWDTRLIRWKKLLIALQTRPGALAMNNPIDGDSLRRTLFRVAGSLAGVSSGSGNPVGWNAPQRDDTLRLLVCKILQADPVRSVPAGIDQVVTGFGAYGGNQPTFTPDRAWFGIAVDTGTNRVWRFKINQWQ